jgi:hypothetical protein
MAHPGPCPTSAAAQSPSGTTAGMDAGATRHGRRLGPLSERLPPTRSSRPLSVGLKNATALSRTQKHRTPEEAAKQRANGITVERAAVLRSLRKQK